MKIIVDLNGGARIEDVQQRVSNAGVKVEHVIPAIGAIFGLCDDADMDSLRALNGVARVAQEGHVQLPPRSRDIPQ
ncbi:hypothetical protein [Roseovarius sp. Pro17]|uniref:hypothetical protein n=1 Tax=Roseovarius sp. Pro17 TaxID=3108175 RepID=UPI002D79655C|nr:hypothetical protein [Roseovarius sp. Pro17]